MPPSSPKQNPPASARIIDLTQPEKGTESNSESSQKSARKRRRREKRSSKKDGTSTPASHENEPSTSKTQLEDGEVSSEKDASSKSSKKPSASKPRRKYRTDKSSRKKSKSPEPPAAINLNSTFTGDDEFIPFGPLPFADADDDVDVAPKSSSKGKEKEREAEDHHRRDEKDEHRRGGGGGARDRENEREWDRGKSTYRDRDDPRDRQNSNGKRRRRDYDSDDGYDNKKQRIDAASRKCPWVNGLELEKCQNVAEMLHKEVEAFVDWISPTHEEDEIRGLIVQQISQAISTKFPDSKTYPFGSYQTKLYLPLGDIDLVVLSDAMAYSDKATVLHALANTLKRSGITTHVTIIAKAKVPIVKFVTTHGKFKVDVSINQANGLVSGNIIQGFLRHMVPTATSGGESKALRSLVMITKAFLAQRSMNEVYTGGLGSYSIVCLAVSFLQMHPKIRRGEIDPEKNLGVLVMEFFELYGERFNYDDVGISLRHGGMYFNKRQRGWAQDYTRRGLFVSIEDPADPSNDISSGSYNFHKVRTAFAGAHGILTATAYMRSSILTSRNKGTSFRLRPNYEPEDLSILCTVMGVTQETINHRRLVQEIYDRRIIHTILGVVPKPIIIEAKITDDDRPNSNSNSKSKSKPKSKSRADADADWRSGAKPPNVDPKSNSKSNADADSKSKDSKSGSKSDSTAGLSILGASRRKEVVQVVEDGWDDDMEFSDEDSGRGDSIYGAGRRGGQTGKQAPPPQLQGGSSSSRRREVYGSDGELYDSDRELYGNARDDAADEDEGRYDIGRQQPPRKRQRTGRRSDQHTVFYVESDDEDDDDEDVLGLTEMEEGEYMSDTESEGSEIVDISRYEPENDRERERRGGARSRSRQRRSGGGGSRRESGGGGASLRKSDKEAYDAKSGEKGEKRPSGLKFKKSNPEKTDGEMRTETGRETKIVSGKETKTETRKETDKTDKTETETKERYRDGPNNEKRSYWLSKTTVGNADGGESSDFGH